MSVLGPILGPVLGPVALSLTRAGVPMWSPRVLFAAGEQGAWYDPSDLSTLFQDSAGTTPVTSTGQPVGKMLDKSGRGNHATQATTTARPTLQQDSGGRYYLSFDGVDDCLVSTGGSSTGSAISLWSAILPSGSTGDVWGSKAGQTGYRLQANASQAQGYMLVGNGTGFVAATAALSSTAKSVLSGRYSGGNAVARVNGVDSAAAAVAGVPGAASTAIGKAQDFAGSFYNGRLYGLIVRGVVSTAAQIASAERYLAARSGVTL